MGLEPVSVPVDPSSRDVGESALKVVVSNILGLYSISLSGGNDKVKNTDAGIGSV